MKRHTAPRGKAVKKKGRRSPAPRGPVPATTDWRVVEAGAGPVSIDPVASAPRSPWEWTEPVLWTYPRYYTTILSREAGPRCLRCGYVEQGA